MKTKRRWPEGIGCPLGKVQKVKALLNEYFRKSPNKSPLFEAIKKAPANQRLTGAFYLECDSAGIRTQDHYIKSVMLYQLSYGIFFATLPPFKAQGIKIEAAKV